MRLSLPVSVVRSFKDAQLNFEKLIGFAALLPRTVRGRVDGTTGAVLAGQDYSVIRHGAGDYTITFDPAFTGVPVVDVTPYFTGGQMTARLKGTLTGAAVNVATETVPGGAFADSNFHFIAMEA